MVTVSDTSISSGSMFMAMLALAAMGASRRCIGRLSKLDSPVVCSTLWSASSRTPEASARIYAFTFASATAAVRSAVFAVSGSLSV